MAIGRIWQSMCITEFLREVKDEGGGEKKSSRYAHPEPLGGGLAL